MHEIRDLHGRDGTDADADARGGLAFPVHQAVGDVAARTEHAHEYRQRVEAVYSAYDATESGPRDARGEQHARAEGASRRERAERMTREVDLPASVLDLPGPREVLPNLRLAEVDRRKFSEYSLNPGHPHNGGKAEGWRALGYDVDSPQARGEAARDLRGMIRDELLARGKVAEARETPFGPTYKVLSAFTGPNGRHATLVTCWLVEGQADRSHPKLTTVWGTASPGQGDSAMTAARQYDSVRTTAAAESIFDGRTIPAGAEGMVLEARLDGACLVEVTLTPQTDDHDGDFVQTLLAQDQYEIIQS
jgi:hypothetical protein